MKVAEVFDEFDREPATAQQKLDHLFKHAKIAVSRYVVIAQAIERKYDFPYLYLHNDYYLHCDPDKLTKNIVDTMRGTMSPDMYEKISQQDLNKIETAWTNMLTALKTWYKVSHESR